MGQYFKLINDTKKEQINSWDLASEDRFGGAKFWEWFYNRYNRILIWLLRESDGSGGGDIVGYDNTPYETLGRWAGDKITLIGDYDESKRWKNTENYEDISRLVNTEVNKALVKDLGKKEAEKERI
jgi:hypothetical protein